MTERAVHTAGQWRTDVPDADDRRSRHIVAVVGKRWHSGVYWHRLGTGIAATVYKGQQGYKPEDIADIEERNDMEPGSGFVVAWMDFITPPVPLAMQGLDAVLPEPTRIATARGEG